MLQLRKCHPARDGCQPGSNSASLGYRRWSSARSLEVLGRLAARLRRAKRNEYVRDFLPSLEACLGRRPAS